MSTPRSQRPIHVLPVTDDRGIPLIDVIAAQGRPMARADGRGAIRALASAMTREIESPLACVIANLELLARRLRTEGGILTDGATELVADAQEGAVRIRGVIGLVRRIARETTDPEAE